MSIFNDSSTLRGQSFGYGLSPFSPTEADSEQFVEADEISVFVDEEGKTNIANQLILHQSADPIDVAEGAEVQFSEGNAFIKALNSSIEKVPVGGIILYPTLSPYDLRQKIRYPTDTPKGFVPCVGQVLKYEDGSEFFVAILPPPPSQGGGSAVPAPVRYLQKVPDGKFEDPVREGALEDIDVVSGIEGLLGGG